LFKFRTGWLESTVLVDKAAQEADLAKLRGLYHKAEPRVLREAIRKLYGAWERRNVDDARKVTNWLDMLVMPANAYEANRLAKELILSVEQKLNQFRNDAAYAQFDKWRRDQRTVFVLEIRYHRALACYQTFDVVGLIEATDLAAALEKDAREWLNAGKEPRRRVLADLALCLRTNSILCLSILQSKLAFQERLRMEEIWRATNLGAFYTLEQEVRKLEPLIRARMHDLVESDFDDVRAAARETLGLSALYQQSVSHADESSAMAEFEGALRLRSWPNTYVYLAMSVYENEPKRAARLLDVALARCPKHALALRLGHLWKNEKRG